MHHEFATMFRGIFTEFKKALKAMFEFNKWRSNKFYKKRYAVDIEHTIFIKDDF